MPSAGDDKQLICVLCGASDATVEHVLPQTLLRKLGLDPNGPETALFRTPLCSASNHRGSALHRQLDVIELISTGQAPNPMTFARLAQWTAWVFMLLGVTRRVSVWPRDHAMDLLRQRFPCTPGVQPGTGNATSGTRVYAALADDSVAASELPRWAVALRKDPRVVLNASDQPVGGRLTSGSALVAADALRLGELVLLVVGPTWRSGAEHERRMDEAAARAGLTHLGSASRLGGLKTQAVSLDAISELFTTDPFDVRTEINLLPQDIRAAVEAFTGFGPDLVGAAQA